MTDNDYRIEDRQGKAKKPNYTLRRILFAVASIAFVASLTIMLTWHGGSRTMALMVEAIYVATALWLTIRFAPRD
ncbi:MAG TPA: hypothetical protein DEP29_03510 [Bifidobacterium sp.]|nr:hypothetical protein [Bifidobacterium sp.]